MGALVASVGGSVPDVEVGWIGGRTGLLVLLQHSTTTFIGPCGGEGRAAVRFFTSCCVIKRTISLISSKSTPLGPGGPEGPGRPSAPFLPG